MGKIKLKGVLLLVFLLLLGPAWEQVWKVGRKLDCKGSKFKKVGRKLDCRGHKFQ